MIDPIMHQMPLTEFLTARLNEDWENANEREGATIEASPFAGAELIIEERRLYRSVHGEGIDITDSWQAWVGSLPLSERAKRTRAEVTAKRAILALHSTPDGLDPACSSIVYSELAEDCETLQALTHPHADHADWNPEWTL